MSWLMSYTDIFIEGNQVTWYYSQSNYDNRVLLTGYRFTKTYALDLSIHEFLIKIIITSFLLYCHCVERLFVLFCVILSV